MTREEIRGAVMPLRLVFWGGLICVLDFSINGFDILNDVVGAALVAVGVWRLLPFRVDDRYATAMRFVSAVAILAVFGALVDQFPMKPPPLVTLGLVVFAMVRLAAVFVFCIAMRWLCAAAELHDAANSWRTTERLFLVIYIIPFGLFYLAAMLAIVTGESFHVDLGPAGLLLLPVFLAPLVHLFISTSRMARSAAEVPPPAEIDLP